MIVLALTHTGRVEVTNYQTAKMPTGVDVPEYIADRFGGFYDALFDRQVQRHDGRAVFLEYAWPVAANVAACATRARPRRSARPSCRSWAPTGRTASPASSPGCTSATTATTSRKTCSFRRPPTTKSYQARYVINHHLSAAASACRGAASYREALPGRMAAEQANVVRLTGWDEAAVSRAMAPERSRSAP